MAAHRYPALAHMAGVAKRSALGDALERAKDRVNDRKEPDSLTQFIS